MQALNHPPHISLAIYDELSVDQLLTAFAAAEQQLGCLRIQFSSLNYFESNDNIVLWAEPVLPDEVRHAFAAIHSTINPGWCHQHYQPTHWIPHCTLASAVPLVKKAEAMALLERPFQAFDVVFDTIDCVSFLPVQVIKEAKLRT